MVTTLMHWSSNPNDKCHYAVNKSPTIQLDNYKTISEALIWMTGKEQDKRKMGDIIEMVGSRVVRCLVVLQLVYMIISGQDLFTE